MKPFAAMEIRNVRNRIALMIPTLIAACLGSLIVPCFAGPVILQDEQDFAGRQVTVMVIRAKKNAPTTDPKLAPFESRLTQLLPEFGFSLENGKSRELAEGEALDLMLKMEKKLSVRMVDAEDADGKVQMKVRCETGSQVLIDSMIRTPPNQLFFLDHRIDDTEHLLIAVGAR